MSSTLIDAKKLTKRQQKTLSFRENKRQKQEIKPNANDRSEEANDDREEENLGEEVMDRELIEEENKTIAEKVDDCDIIIKPDNKKSSPLSKKKPHKKPTTRFIVFVANLPLDIKKEELSKHFESAGTPISVRLITDKKSRRLKGYAFVEFDNPQAMKRALRFHHTKLKNKQIRVELTAGGGGNKSLIRKRKLEEKKKKLNEERRKIHETYIAPKKSKSLDSVDDSTTKILDTNTSEVKVNGNVLTKKPRLKGSNAVKPVKVRNFGS
ncbi:1554_t:CDS:2 [Acaulospora morrowiae]|uniref:1554_t:CDS:1 n=1 Tax=Acaulospora morrowiae TaxID=94023 RepID=A0A9N8VML8_9GLOM|nr:1554_t:CDS:2 [Acaulospora morrowiae]